MAFYRRNDARPDAVPWFSVPVRKPVLIRSNSSNHSTSNEVLTQSNSSPNSDSSGGSETDPNSNSDTSTFLEAKARTMVGELRDLSPTVLRRFAQESQH